MKNTSRNHSQVQVGKTFFSFVVQCNCTSIFLEILFDMRSSKHTHECRIVLTESIQFTYLKYRGLEAVLKLRIKNIISFGFFPLLVKAVMKLEIKDIISFGFFILLVLKLTFL